MGCKERGGGPYLRWQPLQFSVGQQTIGTKLNIYRAGVWWLFIVWILVELRPAQREVEQRQFRMSSNQLFVQHKCTVMFKRNDNFLSRVNRKALWLFNRKNFLRGVHPVSCWEQLTDSSYYCCEIKYIVFVSLFTFVGWSLWNFIIHKKIQNFIPTFYGFLT